MNQIDHHMQAIAFASQVLPIWSEATLENTSLKRFTSTSNIVFLLETSLNIIPNQLVYRVFGTSGITDKSREIRIFNELSRLSQGPKCYGLTDYHRLEEYYKDFVPITHEVLSNEKYLKKIIRRIKRFHGVNMDSVLCGEGNLTLDYPERWRTAIRNKIHVYEKHADFTEIEELIGDQAMEKFLSVLPTDSPVVFSHLDLSLVNILYNPILQKIRFVDVEFAGYSYRSTDVANIINNFRLDFLHKSFPFFNVYYDRTASDEIIAEYVKEYGEGKDMWVEVKRSLICVSFTWAMWSIAEFSEPSDGFSYLDYGLTRFRMFKNEFYDYVQSGGKEHLEKIAKKLFS
ncbi:hypothetical protein SteCoe_17757 [Stentor coeruleus]|uniref:ethanolamine kinase n=1 Tax=Stentor coeruleus TaxID=5963 RepID=A0A1R2BYI3_9CILI|nr:hypothetical protein SteCoe_17757 [Stentor coeruleus]